jgi:hypothetical protein
VMSGARQLQARPEQSEGVRCKALRPRLLGSWMHAVLRSGRLPPSTSDARGSVLPGCLSRQYACNEDTLSWAPAV